MTVHLLRGDDEALLAAAAHDLVKRLVGDGDRSLMVDEFDGDDYSIGEVMDAARTPPFLTERRVVVARGVQRFAAGDLEPLSAALGDLLESTDLVLTAGGGRLPKALLDGLKAAGVVIDDTDPPSGARDRRAWLDEQLAVAPVRLDAGARAVVADQLGDDLGRLAGLLDTLAATFGRDARVGVDDVAPFLGEAGAVPPWELTDAIDRGDTAVALDRLARTMAAGGRHPLVVMATLHNHYTRLLRLDGSDITGEKEAAALLGVRSPFQARKALDAARRLGHDGIAKAITLLADADLDLRGLKDWPEGLVMEVLVARLSRLAPTGARRPASRART